jgi:hypothetical protein
MFKYLTSAGFFLLWLAESLSANPRHKHKWIETEPNSSVSLNTSPRQMAMIQLFLSG